MKLSLLSVAAASASIASAAPKNLKARQSGVQGFDISSYQENFDYAGAYGAGARFAIIKATEGTSHVDPVFDTHYAGTSDAGMIRGAYHFALPDSSGAAAQVEHFVSNGGGWSKDDITLPGMLDIETNPYGDQCYGLGADGMVAWIQEFADTYNSKIGQYPMIYTSPSWWESCTGNSAAFAETCPLVMARWSDSPGDPVGGWSTHTIWQNTDSYEFGGDGDIFNGDEAGLKKLANGE